MPLLLHVPLGAHRNPLLQVATSEVTMFLADYYMYRSLPRWAPTAATAATTVSLFALIHHLGEWPQR